jgi:bifunctional non-homologous end joining protein LigD
MGLATYKHKRTFSKTPEPAGGKPESDELRFVIQKHDASHLHYDFRLELNGVLKSWAVPKGPSNDPSVKRLAMMVEDHPFDYRNFEGIIPKGEYGGGTVIIWDEGTYEPEEKSSADKSAREKLIAQQLKKGKLVFVLHGEKLKGKFALVKSSYQGENSWLLMKVKDKYAKNTDVTRHGRSVISGKTIGEMEKSPDNVYSQNKTKKTTAVTKAKGTKKKTVTANHKGKKAAFPKTLAPMLATLVDKPFDDAGWQYEVKWDGYRAIAHVNGVSVSIKSRNNKSFSEKFYPVTDALKSLDLKAVLDGEIIVSTDEGVSNFGKLQSWRSEADGLLQFYVFDILWKDGYSLMHLPLNERREILAETIKENEVIHISQTFDISGTAFYEAAGKLKLEGIIAKRADSIYTPGLRSRDWLKIKINQRHEVIIGGYTQNEGSSRSFSSLLVGVNKNGKLHYTGKIGTGFSNKLQQSMLKQFKPLIQKTHPFYQEPDINKPSRFRPNPPRSSVTWLKPALVCEVSYTELTADGIMRHPSFEGMREDKKATEVKEEKAMPVKTAIKKSQLQSTKIIHTRKTGERKTLLNPTEKQQQKKINGNIITFTNLNKIYWPKEKYTKRDLINYYYRVAEIMLPYLKKRPQSLNRYPGGIAGESFYQKDMTGKVPDWVELFPYTSEGKNKNFMVCNSEADLLLMASLGCIEINPWSSTVDNPDNPDWCAIDLDPDKNDFSQVVETALVTKQILDAASVQGYCKTSGSTGLHIYIPLNGKYSYEESKDFARLIATLVQKQLPGFTSIERTRSKRKGKIYIDFLQNRAQATLASAYSARPKPGATVSMPLHWEEVKKGLSIADFNIINAPDRLTETGDIFKPVLGKGINMLKAIKALESFE